MNALLRHTGNIHIGLQLSSSLGGFFGIVAGNIKAGFVFVSNGYVTARDGIMGLINNTNI